MKVTFPLVADADKKISASYDVLWPLIGIAHRVTFVIERATMKVLATFKHELSATNIATTFSSFWTTSIASVTLNCARYKLGHHVDDIFAAPADRSVGLTDLASSRRGNSSREKSRPKSFKSSSS